MGGVYGIWVYGCIVCVSCPVFYTRTPPPCRRRRQACARSVKCSTVGAGESERMEDRARSSSGRSGQIRLVCVCCVLCARVLCVCERGGWSGGRRGRGRRAWVGQCEMRHATADMRQTWEQKKRQNVSDRAARLRIHVCPMYACTAACNGHGRTWAWASRRGGGRGVSG